MVDETLARFAIYEHVLSSKDLNQALDRLTDIAITTDSDSIFSYTEDLRSLVIDSKEILWSVK
jgi:hypothetical protein